MNHSGVAKKKKVASVCVVKEGWGYYRGRNKREPLYNKIKIYDKTT